MKRSRSVSDTYLALDAKDGYVRGFGDDLTCRAYWIHRISDDSDDTTTKKKRAYHFMLGIHKDRRSPATIGYRGTIETTGSRETPQAFTMRLLYKQNPLPQFRFLWRMLYPYFLHEGEIVNWISIEQLFLWQYPGIEHANQVLEILEARGLVKSVGKETTETPVTYSVIRETMHIDYMLDDTKIPKLGQITFNDPYGSNTLIRHDNIHVILECGKSIEKKLRRRPWEDYYDDDDQENEIK